MFRVLLIGDSIRMHYQPYVGSELRSEAEIDGPSENCESSRKTRARLAEWLESHPADLIHINCGLHDIRVDHGATGPQVPLNEYVANVEAILRHAQGHADRVIWATSTPINEALHQRIKESRRSEADLFRYNEAGKDVARANGVEINDLWKVIVSHGAGDLWEQDGVHFNDHGYMLLGRRVADKLRCCFPRPAGESA
jgi:isoamyl acetate esterase